MSKRFWSFFIIISCLLQTLTGLEIKRVILSTNDNPNYIQFWPVVASMWQAMGIRPTLALIGKDDVAVDSSLGDVLRFSPIKDVPESLQAQVIRLFLPVLYPEEGCIISDIDMLPISKSYFIEGAAKCPDDAFLVYRDQAGGGMRFPMCYVAAKGKVFSSVFGITKADQFDDLIVKWAKLGHGWNTDELMLYQTLINWEQEPSHHICRLGHHVGPRLDRMCWKTEVSEQEVLGCIDAHCPRPYSEHQKSINQIADIVLKHLQKAKTESSNPL